MQEDSFIQEERIKQDVIRYIQVRYQFHLSTSLANYSGVFVFVYFLVR